MRQLLLLCCVLLCGKFTAVKAQTTYGDSLTVKVQASIQTTPASITIDWPADADASGYIISRKLKTASGWGSPLATIAGTSTQYVDNTVSTGVLYDYKIQMNSSGTPVKYGYLSSGIDVQANSNRGIALVVIENTYISNVVYQDAINELLTDLELDGWFPKSIYVNKADAVTAVKSLIVTAYNEEPLRTKLLLLMGNVPVPYSGKLYPDGHTDHEGAWPTDMYYADMNGSWSDASINVTVSSNVKNHNTPGDGKFDQSYLPSDVELQVGRVDLSDLPAFSHNEETLLLKYMNKLHRFKTAQITVQDKALIDDNFTSFAEGFSQNGYRNFSPIVGRNNIFTNDYFTQLSYNTTTTGTYLWSYGCGGGTYTSAGGIGSTTNFAADSLSSVFTMMFGSYFGDWNYTNAFLRAPLAQGNTLTNCWAGRPNWHFYHMAMGDNIGYSVRLSQNNSSIYFSSTLTGLSRIVSVGFMGDPSLRNNYIAQVSNLNIIATGVSNTLSWTPGGSEIGYNVYRRYADSTNFVKLNSALITGTGFTDSSLPVAGLVYYYVKAVEYKVTPSGTYYNESLGVRDTAQVSVGVNVVLSQNGFNVYPNPFTNAITIVCDDRQEIEIHTIKGEKVYAGKVSGSATIDLSFLDVGAYVLSVCDAQKNVSRTKIFKTK